MSSKDLKYKIASFLVSLADKIIKNKEKSNNQESVQEKPKEKNQLNSEILQKELSKFVKLKGLTVDDLEDFDSEKFNSDFKQYLIDNNYDCEGLAMRANLINPGTENEEQEPVEIKKLPRNIRKISEDLNDCIEGLEIFSRTTNMTPGLVCYTIEKIAPNDKRHYVTYRPSPRVITQVHENGANGGTIILTYSHKFVKSVDFNGRKTGKVISEDEALYTPLTKEHALYVCKVLNAQSKLFYIQQMKEQQKTK